MICLQCGTEIIPGITQHVCTNAPRSMSEPVSDTIQARLASATAAMQAEITRLRARIVELEAKGEPVAWAFKWNGSNDFVSAVCWSNPEVGRGWRDIAEGKHGTIVPLYTHPPEPRKVRMLTDGEIIDVDRAQREAFERGCKTLERYERLIIRKSCEVNGLELED